MDQLLKKVAEVLCTVYAPSHSCLYSLKRMGTTGTRRHFRDRKKELTADDKKQIKTLLAQIMSFDIDSENHGHIYYRHLLYRDMFELLR
jgi:tryptophan synthase alpha subunit